MKSILLFSFFFFGGFSIVGQTNFADISVVKLDSLAFVALESGERNPIPFADEIVTREANNPSIYLNNAYTVLAIVHKNKGHFVLALEYNFLALSVAEKLKDNARISVSYNNIGIIYVLQKNYQRAIDYFEKSLKLEEKLHNSAQKSIRLYNLGDCYLKLKQFDEALGFFTSSLVIEKKLKNDLGVLYAQLGIAEVYIRLNRFSDVSLTLTEANKLMSFSDADAKLLYYRLKGEEAIGNSNTSEALLWLHMLEKFSIDKDLKNDLLDVYLLLSTIYQKSNDFKMALSYSRKYIQLNEQLQSNFIKNQLEDHTFKNELKGKQLEISLLQEEKELAKKNEESVRVLHALDVKIILFVVGALIVILSFVFLGIRKFMQISEK